MSEELKQLLPCPFCGALDELEPSGLSVECTRCGVMGPDNLAGAKCTEDAIKFWNTRQSSELATLKAECERLNKLLEYSADVGRAEIKSLMEECDGLRKALKNLISATQRPWLDGANPVTKAVREAEQSLIYRSENP